MFPEWMTAIWLRLKALVYRRRLERDLDDELQFHLAMREQKLVEQGMPPEEAHYAARRAFGNPTQARESNRKLWTFPFLETLARDLRYGLRQLRRNPGFTIVAVLTLALGLGATTSVFTAANDFLLRPLPFRDSDRLVFLKGYSAKDARLWGIDQPSYKYLRDHNDVFEEMAAWSEMTNDHDFNLTGAEGPERVPAMKVTAEFFSVLGVKPVLGRTFTTDEDRPGGGLVAVISYALWQTRYGGNPRVLGKNIILNGKGYTLIGVLPAGFRFSTASEAVWVPLRASLDEGYGGYYLSVVARLRHGVALAQAQADMDTLGARLAQQFPRWEKDQRVAVEGVRAQYVGSLGPALFALLVAAGFVLLIACVNLANLLLARTARRYKEIAVRQALGASQARIVRQLLIESFLLAILGGATGLLMAFADERIFYAVLPADWHPLTPGGIDHTVLLFTFVTALLTVFIFGMAPAWTAKGPNLNEALKEGIRTSQTCGQRFRIAMVAVEVALATVLVVGTGLLMKSFVRLSASNLGFQSENILTVRLARTTKGVDAFYREVMERIKAFPKVRAAGAVNIMPLSGGAWGQDITIEGRPPRPPGDYIWAAHRSVTAGYFRAMGIPVLRGRSFTAGDEGKSVAVISETMARRYWPGEDPVGKRFGVNCSGGGCNWKTVIGVVGDVEEDSATAEPTTATYFPETFNNMTLVVRAAQDPKALAADVRDIIHSVDPNQPVGTIRTMENVVADSVAPRRLTMLISVLFAALALLLAMIGIYGVVSYSVAQRSHEIGIRMALGAEKSDVLRMVIGQGLKLTFIGVAIGIAGALALTRFLASLLYDVQPTDPLTFIAVSVILVAVALLACYIPARRAAKVDPMVALRYE
jgi:putative ABC transport system permease protein